MTLVSPLVILGIDPGIADTGYGIVEKLGDKYTMRACGSIRTDKGKELPERLLELYNELKGIIQLHKPDVLAVEELFFAKNVKTAIMVSHARGVALMAGREAGLPVREFKPLEIKQALTGYGRADKNQIQQMVKTILGLPAVPKPDDAADALATAICSGQTKIYTDN